jgi:hypothetical protein
MSRKPIVYLVNNKGLDMEGSKAYGDLQVLYGTPQDVFSTSKKAFELKEKLKDAQSGDYLAVAGNMILVLLAFGILYEKFGYVNLLLFDVRTSQYTARVVPKHQLKGGE